MRGRSPALEGTAVHRRALATVPKALQDPSSHRFHCTDDPNQG